MRTRAHDGQPTLIARSPAPKGVGIGAARSVLRAAVPLAAIAAALWGGLAPLHADDGATEQVLGRNHQLRLHETATPDGLHFAYVTADMETREFWVVHDGQEDQKFKMVSGDLSFSRDGGRFGYSAHQADEGASFYVIDGKPIGPFQRTLGRSLRFRPQGDRLAYFVKKEGKWRLVLDGEEDGQLWDDFDNASLEFSPDGSHIVYEGVVGEWEGGDHHAVIDRVKGPRFDAIWPFVFSEDGKRVGYKARAGDKYVVVVDGEAGPDYDGISDDDPVFSRDGKHVAYMAKKGGMWRLVLDGREDSQLWDQIGAGSPVFGPDSTRTAYSAAIGEWEGGDHFAVIDGVRGPRFDAVWPFVFSQDGKRVAYKAQSGDKYVVVVDGEVGPEYDGIQGPVFSPDGKRVGYTARAGDKHIVVVDGEPGPRYDSIAKNNPIFSPDGRHVAYKAKKDGKWRLVLDGEEDGRLWDDFAAASPQFSPDGTRLAYHAAIGEWKGGERYAVIDGVKGPRFDDIWPFVFSRDGSRVGYKARSGRNHVVVVDGELGPSYLSIGGIGRSKGKDPLGHERIFVSGLIGQENPGLEPGVIMFSPSGRHLAYFGRTSDDKWRLNLDGTEGPSYDLVGKVAFFESEGCVRYLAAKGDALVLVTQLFPAEE